MPVARSLQVIEYYLFSRVDRYVHVAVTNTLHDHIQQSESVTLLNWLSKISYRRIHRATGKDVQPGTGEWILRNAEFLEWTKSSVSSILFLHGIRFRKDETHVQRGGLPFSLHIYGACNGCLLLLCARNLAEPVNSNLDEIMRSIMKQLSSFETRAPNQRSSRGSIPKERERDVTTDGGEISPMDLEECLELILVVLEDDAAYLFLDTT